MLFFSFRDHQCPAICLACPVYHQHPPNVPDIQRWALWSSINLRPAIINFWIEIIGKTIKTNHVKLNFCQSFSVKSNILFQHKKKKLFAIFTVEIIEWSWTLAYIFFGFLLSRQSLIIWKYIWNRIFIFRLPHRTSGTGLIMFLGVGRFPEGELMVVMMNTVTAADTEVKVLHSVKDCGIWNQHPQGMGEQSLLQI